MSVDHVNPKDLGFDFNAACEEGISDPYFGFEYPEPLPVSPIHPYKSIPGTPMTTKPASMDAPDPCGQPKSQEPQHPKVPQGKLYSLDSTTGRFIAVPSKLIFRPCSPPNAASSPRVNKMPRSGHETMGPPPPGPLDKGRLRPTAPSNASPAGGSPLNPSSKRKADADENSNFERFNDSQLHSVMPSPLSSLSPPSLTAGQPPMKRQRLHRDQQVENDHQHWHKIDGGRAKNGKRNGKSMWREQEIAALAEAREYKRRETEAIARAQYYRRLRRESQE